MPRRRAPVGVSGVKPRVSRPRPPRSSQQAASSRRRWRCVLRRSSCRSAGRNNPPAVPSDRLFDPAGDGQDAVCPGICREHLGGRPRRRPSRTRTRRSIAAAVCGARVSAVTVSMSAGATSGRSCAMGLRRSTTSSTRRSAASANATAARGGNGSRGTVCGTDRKLRVVRRCSAAGDGGGHAAIPTGGGSQSMIGVVSDTGSDEIRDAVIGALQRWVRLRRHLLESRRHIHDRTVRRRRMHP